MLLPGHVGAQALAAPLALYPTLPGRVAALPQRLQLGVQPLPAAAVMREELPSGLLVHPRPDVHGNL